MSSMVLRRSGSPPSSTEWQAQFMALLPAIQKHARRLIQRSCLRDRDESLQAAVAYAAVGFARLAALGQAHKGYPSTLARFGLKQHRAGRLVGGRVNSHDVGSAKCRVRNGCMIESFEDWNEVLAENRRATPAEIAALRIDFADWLRSVSSRDRQLVALLARGETTQNAAVLLGVSAGRISQLRRELFVSWQRFQGEGGASCA